MSVVQAAVTQYDVLRLLLLRETRTENPESRLGYLWSLVDPTLWVIMFYLMFAYGGRAGPQHGMEVLPYLATGVCTFKAFQTVSTSVPMRVNTRLLALPQITALDLILAKALLKALTMVIVFLLLVSSAMLITGSTTPVDEPLQVIGGMALAVSLGFGLGLVLTAAQRKSKAAKSLRTILGRVLFWTSGMFFVADDLPSAAREVALYNPVLHSVELVRAGWFQGYRALHADPGYATAWAVGLLLFGLTWERMTRENQS